MVGFCLHNATGYRFSQTCLGVFGVQAIKSALAIRVCIIHSGVEVDLHPLMGCHPVLHCPAGPQLAPSYQQMHLHATSPGSQPPAHEGHACDFKASLEYIIAVKGGHIKVLSLSNI